jgi:GTP diphosphokinase / guanosine-3',5'-bis(diphosphate) 3'-diphosphatase
MARENIPIEQVYDLPLEKNCKYGKDTMADLSVLLTECIKYMPKPDINFITKGYYFCIDSHKNVFRKSGEPYYIHPLKVALSLLRTFSITDNESIVAALLHDTVEDVENITYGTIRSKFGADVAQIVDGVTKIKGANTQHMDKAATYGKLFLTLVNDIRTIYIKLADRLDNMKTLFHLPPHKQKAIAYETLNFYTPFCQRLGLTKVRRDFEDLSLYFIDPEAFDIIRTSLENKGRIFIEYMKNFIMQIGTELYNKKVPHIITIEHKHVYEIYKMIEMGKTLKEIDNFYSMVITLDNEDFTECYRVYGVIANVFGPVSSLIDYIARPKVNLYRALHSTHLGPGRKMVEIIIRTKEMDKIAVEGISSIYPIHLSQKHIQFNEYEISEWVEWMQNIIESKDEDAIQKIWGSIRKNLYEDEITIYHKDGKEYKLPKGSSPIDLAFNIDQEIALHCISAKINGKIKNLDYELQDNDQVELLTSPNQNPEEEWQDFVVTNKAIVGLFNYFLESDNTAAKPVKKVEENKEMRLKITCEDRPGLLHDITGAIGELNIQRINISTTDSVFEGIFTLNEIEESVLNQVFNNVAMIRGIKGFTKMEN